LDMSSVMPNADCQIMWKMYKVAYQPDTKSEHVHHIFFSGCRVAARAVGGPTCYNFFYRRAPHRIAVPRIAGPLIMYDRPLARPPAELPHQRRAAWHVPIRLRAEPPAACEAAGGPGAQAAGARAVPRPRHPHPRVLVPGEQERARGGQGAGHGGGAACGHGVRMGRVQRAGGAHVLARRLRACVRRDVRGL
jgi:hypothetical protein